MVWYKDNYNDIVISTRVRLARNLDKVPFPKNLADKSEAIEKIRLAVENSNSYLNLDYIDLNACDTIKKQQLAEEHLISPQMIEGKDKSVFINKDKTASIMLMEEDHIRLQVIMSGNKPDEAFDTANKIDDVLEETLSYAFDEKFGYLTACPTNVGTGMRVSLMMHLPALTMTKSINNVISSAGGMGIAVRGLYGEGTSAEGNMYQISNQTTIGLSENEIIERLKTVTDRIIEMEKKAREILLNNNKTRLFDKLYRSYGILKFARSLTSSEAKTLLSDVLLGRNMGIIEEKGKISPVECMVFTAPSFISGIQNLSPGERDIKRAELIRENI